MLRTREHLAAVKPVGKVLVIELLHFENELVDSDQLELPAANEKTPGKRNEDGGDV